MKKAPSQRSVGKNIAVVKYLSAVMESRDDVEIRDTLLRRVEELEKEKRELQKDVEVLCQQHAGSMGAIDVMARMQARRAAGLDQELAASKHKVASLTMECSDLKRELAEAYRAKSDVADLWKAELDKTRKVEEDARFYQSQAIAALAERDEASFLADTLERGKARAEQQVMQLTSRVRELENTRLELEPRQAELEGRLAAAEAELDPLRELAAAVHEHFGGGAEEAAKALGVDAERPGSARSPEAAGPLAEEAAARQRADTEALIARLRDSRPDIERLKRQVAEEQQRAEVLQHRAKAAEGATAMLQESWCTELQRIRGESAVARGEVLDLLKRQDEWQSEVLAQLLEEVHRAGEEAAASRKQEEARREEERTEFEHTKKDLEGHLAALQRLLSRDIQERQVAQALEEDALESASSTSNSRGFPTAEEEDGREALAQALHEKVSALLLMSQQEERYHMERKTAGALQEAVHSLQAKLTQVSREKVEALLSVAQLKVELIRQEDRAKELEWQLQQEQSTSIINRMLPAQWGQKATPVAGAPSQAPGSSPPSLLVTPAPSQNRGLPSSAASPSTSMSHALLLGSFHLPSWLKGGTLKTGLNEEAAGVAGREDDAVSRLRVENASLADSIQSLRHSTQAARRMRTALAKAGLGVGDDQPGDGSIVDQVAAEARQLRVALGGSQLPVSWPSQDASETALVPLGEVPDVVAKTGMDAQAPHEAATAAGLEMAELVLLLANLRRDCSRHSSVTCH